MNRMRQSGISLITAVFLLVIFSALGIFMLTLSTTQEYTMTYGVRGARAYQAARAGIEWGAHHALNDGDCTTAMPRTLTLSSGGLAGFSVDVSCTMTTHTEKGLTFRVFTLDADAASQSPGFGQPGHVRRVIRATVTDATP